MMKTAWIIWKKYMKKMGAEEMIGMLIQPILWVVIFSKGMASMMGAGINGEYLSFMLPGIMALTTLGGAIGGGFTWLSERNAGLVREYWVAPVPRIGILLGNIAASNTKSLLQTVVIVAVGLLAGAALSTSIPGVLGSLVLVAGFGLGFGGIALSIASSTDNEGGYHAMIMLLNLPLLFLSNALYALEALPKWMQVAAKINPTSYLVDGIRQLMMNTPGDFPLWLCFTVVTGFGLLFLLLSVGAFRKSQQ
ncbi:MAG: ABC transporter permease [Spirochaetaceae bacterium]|nr:ABC transporter permease [Spirochaetaceae bacterium]